MKQEPPKKTIAEVALEVGAFMFALGGASSADAIARATALAQRGESLRKQIAIYMREPEPDDDEES